MSIRPVSESLPIQLLAVHDQVMRYFRPMLNRFRMTDQQWRVLRVIAAEGDIDFGDLGRTCVIQPASLSRMLETLEERGWVSRTVRPSDRRQRLVTLTETGRAVFEQASAETERIYKSLEDDLGPAYGPAIGVLNDLRFRMERAAAGN